MDMSTPAVPTTTLTERPPVAFGPIRCDGLVTFRLWAPEQAAVSLAIEGREPMPMEGGADGCFAVTTAAPDGCRYRFLLADGALVPDPASRFQPEDVHGPSEIIAEDAFVWSDHGWRGLSWHEAVIYELHVGTFTPEGTFRAAAAKLPYLKSLGISVIEMMPIGDFPGRWSWGYDGVLLFAPDSRYGRPDDLKFFVDRAHALGLAVLLDVVYNHFGPDGNYLPLLAPVHTDRYATPWGEAVDFGSRGTTSMRDLVLANVRMWIGEFHLDGLRIDAAHEIRDVAPDHILTAIAETARAAGGDRKIHLVLESARLEADRMPPDGGFDSQWNDDLHHALHAAITGETAKDYADYVARPDILARALAEGVLSCGEEEPDISLPPSASVSFLQNHDQVGNRPHGERIGMLAPPAAVRAAAAAVLLAPQIPMLFQGEEWAASAPFPFFADLAPAFASAVREGRIATFAADPDNLLDPFDSATFASARLDWSEQRRRRHARVLDWYRAILRIRRREIVPLVAGIRGAGQWQVDHGVIRVTWQGEARDLMLTLNLNSRHVPLPAPLRGKPIWQEGRVSSGLCPPWFVAWSVRRREG
ncbi:malto-oligosyltrehalose trehalohydrolase [Pleomorphomonas sp. NRK KF1]|uniref:malto-oligosyltrehalose trehalohydrolase n=1 Tax=Pleomorphomonas sp. NRK KF1 TaxID=2943000 RepID=UPI0020436516|nr:malto-oligosyltrehalose trehalohydrolase [Pleomorphomonas sp. NRK KF1]MCM5552233.1 malto-oligosyltrehalose trehalohydrolase [Pleomorphomonas sp. NRK KF1]